MAVITASPKVNIKNLGMAVTNTPNSQVIKPRIRPIDPRSEYVSGGGNSWLTANFLKSLPRYVDDVTADFGSDLYDRMLNDAQVASMFRLLRLSVVGNDYKLLGQVSDKNRQDYGISQEITDFCARNLKSLDTEFITILLSMLEALGYGNKVAEITYTECNKGQDAGKICLRSIKVKPRDVYLFVIDAYYNLVGILGLLPGTSNTIIGYNLIAVSKDGTNLPANFLPRDKFWVYSFSPKDNDPRGTSLLRPAYSGWFAKQQSWQDYLKYLSQFGSPSLIAKLPPATESQNLFDSDNNLVVDPTTGLPLRLDARLAYEDTLAGFRNGSFMVIPSDAEVQALTVPNGGGEFQNAFSFFNTEIMQAITSQSLGTSEGQHNARAASETHIGVLDRLVAYCKETLCNSFEKDVLYNLVFCNYGQDAADMYTPELVLPDIEQKDFVGYANGISALVKYSYLDKSQYQGIDAMLGLPPRDPDSLLEIDIPMQPGSENPDSDSEGNEVEQPATKDNVMSEVENTDDYVASNGNKDIKPKRNKKVGK